MAFQINRADMKLLVEAGYSSTLRAIDTDVAPIFEALETWMPEHGAGMIGRAMQEMVAGQIETAAGTLQSLIASDRTGRNEARALLAMCRALQKDMAAVEELARQLEGTGGSAESFASLLLRGNAETSQGHQGLAKEAAE